ncbi:glycosyltransferase family 2 protein [Gemmatimonas phototrophica]|uniref:Dolichol-P-glucose synthetase n=1 Tax=Gemmatimonas phototrophica TaxID=1379270 RepID=A0A143BMT1_9BACT|nr:glycosyltransferase family 2 protein [Gemmatimonas phototrophica]AMW05822.1 dolichol-P-glucose synthetase [Gemmatimonas phototrophica]
MELTILMPCLNEARTLGVCIAKARAFLATHAITGEVLIADNGSTDGSQTLAVNAGARVVPIADRGYGAALRGGIQAAHGRFVIFGDADDSYDFSALLPFVEALRAGAEVVVGNRFRGGIGPGAMPFLHRYLGNPVLSWLGRLFFKVPLGDFHCGLRGLNRQAFAAVPLQTTGMEFASEMIVRSSLHGLRIREVPTTLQKDGRDRPPHLRTWRDGWRHLRFLLSFSPRWLFLYPGLAMILGGGALMLRLMYGPLPVAGVTLDVHTMLYAAALVLVGVQVTLFAIMARTYAITAGLLPADPLLKSLWQRITLETGLVLSAVFIALGVAIGGLAVVGWRDRAFGSIDPVDTMRLVIPSMLLLVIGVQGCFASFILSLLGLPSDQRRGA